MSRLTNLSPVIATLAPVLAKQSDGHGHSKAAEPWRTWYSLARWKRLRLKIFKRDLFTCQQPGCRRLEGNTALLVADHRVPHRGDPVLFWDEANVQTLCKSCHDRVKQVEERRGQRGG